MSSIIAKAADDAALLLEGLDVIARITSSPTVTKAEAIVTAIRAVLTALEKASTGSVTPDAVRAELAALEKAISDNDSKADDELAAKFNWRSGPDGP